MYIYGNTCLHTVKLFIFAKHFILCISCIGQFTNLRSQQNTYSLLMNYTAYNLKSANSSVHEHVQCHQIWCPRNEMSYFTVI